MFIELLKAIRTRGNMIWEDDGVILSRFGVLAFSRNNFHFRSSVLPTLMCSIFVYFFINTVQFRYLLCKGN